MKRLVLTLCLLVSLFASVVTVHAQRAEVINLFPRQISINSSVFSNVIVIDNRLDTAYLGYVKRGGFNRKSILKLQGSFKDELTTAINRMLTSAAIKPGTLAITVENFMLSEYTAGIDETGEFKFAARCYFSQDDTLFRHVMNIDTTFKVKGVEVSDQLLAMFPEALGSIIKEMAGFELITFVAKGNYSLYDVEHMHELEKKDIPVYNVAVPQKGVYLSWKDFSQNQPSRKDVIVETRKGFNRPLVYNMKANGKKGSELKHKYYYIVSTGEKIFASNKFGLYEITKKNSDFYFTGTSNDDADAGTIILASALMGFAGGLAAAHNDLAIFEFKIDHLTGKFVALRKIKD